MLKELSTAGLYTRSHWGNKLATAGPIIAKRLGRQILLSQPDSVMTTISEFLMECDASFSNNYRINTIDTAYLTGLCKAYLCTCTYPDRDTPYSPGGLSGDIPHACPWSEYAIKALRTVYLCIAPIFQL